MTATINKSDLALKLEHYFGLKMECTFVPFSKSRSAKNKTPNMNYKITILHNDKPILKDIDYSAGFRCLPELQKFVYSKYQDRQQIENATETGRLNEYWGMEILSFSNNGKRLTPSICDVIHCLISDSDVIDYSCFKDWADNLGYSDDSISAKSIYEECLKIALALRSAIGDSKLQELKECFIDY
jgi:hypothetical protein